ncbi:MAG: TonB-dependent receptor [Pseudomonadota bacterium]
MSRFVKYAQFAALCCVVCQVTANDDSKLEEMFVTGVRTERLAKIPKSVAVITQDDISAAAATDLASLLAQEANLEIRSVTGNDKFSGIDIRGQGDTFSSNVLVLVDGVRLNAPDLSGADFSAVSLGQIERIEVIRGGGGVRYGNGAVGGVINIITKDAKAKGMMLDASASYGSFNTAESRVSFAASGQKAGLKLDAVIFDSDGFRHNGDLRKDDFSARLRYQPATWLELDLLARYHKDRYGLPGSISRQAFLQSSLSRRQSQNPDDRGDTTDRRYRAKITAQLAAFGKLSILGDYRSRDNPFVIGFSPLLTVADQQSKIHENSSTLELNYEFARQLGDFELNFSGGLSRYRSRYGQRRNGVSLVDQSEFFPGSIDNQSGFADARISYVDILALNVGYRKDVFDLKRRDERLREFCDFETVTVQIPQVIPFIGTIFRSVDTVVETNCRNEFEITNQSTPRWRNEAYEVGLVVTPIRSLNIFVSHSRSFRNPNVDELTLGAPDLGPQTGIHWDVGFRLSIANALELSAALFKIDVENEIFFGFDPASSQNLNLNLDGSTNRRGGEVELRVKPHRLIRLWASYGFVKATNEDTGFAVPLVAEDTFTLGGQINTDNGLSLQCVARYVGPRFDGNDFNNRTFREVDSYAVLDAKLSYSFDRYFVSIGANNLLNEIYATSVYSGTYFPMPERNLFASVGISL